MLHREEEILSYFSRFQCIKGINFLPCIDYKIHTQSYPKECSILLNRFLVLLEACIIKKFHFASIRKRSVVIFLPYIRKELSEGVTSCQQNIAIMVICRKSTL